MSNEKPLRLDPGFYEHSDSLRFIRDDAHYRMVAPDALLFSTLARISASIPPSWVLPAFVGSYKPAALCVAIVGRSGTGKSAANSAAREILNIVHDEYRFDLSSGTGQGMIEAYFRASRKGEEGYEEGSKIQKFLGCHFYVDEGQKLLAASSKKEDITLDTVRELSTGEPTGQTNASASTSRYLPANSAAFGLVVGFQPVVAANFVTLGAGLGTPQRFLWAYAISPDQTDFPPEARGELHVTILPHTSERRVFTFDDSIALEIRRQRAAVQRGEIELDELEGHDFLKRMKVAVCLARLENETHVSIQRWALAEMVTEVSNNVLRDIQEQGQRAEQARREEASDHRAEGVVRVQEKTREACAWSGALAMARKLDREQKTLNASALSSSTSSADRGKADIQDMIEVLLREQWAIEIPRPKQSPLYKAGKVPPPAK
jgi:hypothetical protein